MVSSFCLKPAGVMAERSVVACVLQMSLAHASSEEAANEDRLVVVRSTGQRFKAKRATGRRSTDETAVAIVVQMPISDARLLL